MTRLTRLAMAGGVVTFLSSSVALAAPVDEAAARHDAHTRADALVGP